LLGGIPPSRAAKFGRTAGGKIPPLAPNFAKRNLILRIALNATNGSI